MIALEKMEAFHKHLDSCKQCEEHPFDLCPVGAPLLLACGRVEGAPRNEAQHTGFEALYGAFVEEKS